MNLRPFRTLLLRFLPLLIVYSSGVLYAEDRGGYTGSFIRLGLGARARAMGGAFTAIPGSGYNAYYNPAGLPDLSSREFILSYRDLSLGREFYYTGIAVKVPPTAGIALGWLHAGIDNIDGRDSDGNHTQTFSDSQNGFMFAFGVQVLDNLNLGIGGTILREELVNITATGFGLNLGIIYKPLPFLTTGASVRDINAQYSWNSDSLFDLGSTTINQFPTVYTAGAGIDVKKYDTLVVIDVFKNSKSDTGVRFGLENRTLDTLILRTGMNDGDFTAGFGLRIPFKGNVGLLNYALEMNERDPDTPQIVSFSILF